MSEVTKEDFTADMPAGKLLGQLFDEFCRTEQGVALLSLQCVVDNDNPAFRQLIIRNRMRRAFEAGYDACKYGNTVDNAVQMEVQEILRS